MADDQWGINWDNLEHPENETGGNFKLNYEEIHRKRKRIFSGAGSVQQDEAFQRAAVLSDGEGGRLETESETTVYQLACGCTVDSLEKTRKTPSGNLVCAEKHYFECDLCGIVCEPGQEFFFHEGEAERTMHKTCAYKYVGDLRVAAATGELKVDMQRYIELKRIHRALANLLTQ